MTREALKKLNEKQMNYCKTLSALIDRAKINYGSYLEIEENNRRQQSPPVPLVQLVRAAAS